MALPQASQDVKVGMAEQAVWGTAVADDQAFIQLDVKPIQLPQSFTLRKNEGATGSRWPQTPDYFVDQKGVITEFEIEGDLKIDELVHFLVGHIQKVVEGATTPFKKTYTCDTAAPQPDFATGNAGFTYTFAVWSPQTGDSYKLMDCIFPSIAISFKPGKPATFKLKVVGRGVPQAMTPTGAWTRSANQFLYWNQMLRKTINFGAGNVGLVLGGTGIDLSFEKRLEPYGQELVGTQWVPFSYHVDQFLQKFTVHALLDSSLATAIANFKATTSVVVNLGIGNATAGNADNDFDITFPGIFNTDPKRVFDPLIQVAYAGEMASASGASTPFTIIVADGTDRNW